METMESDEENEAGLFLLGFDDKGKEVHIPGPEKALLEKNPDLAFDKNGDPMDMPTLRASSEAGIIEDNFVLTGSNEAGKMEYSETIESLLHLVKKYYNSPTDNQKEIFKCLL
jgi:hypothetical protein